MLSLIFTLFASAFAQDCQETLIQLKDIHARQMEMKTTRVIVLDSQTSDPAEVGYGNGTEEVSLSQLLSEREAWIKVHPDITKVPELEQAPLKAIDLAVKKVFEDSVFKDMALLSRRMAVDYLKQCKDKSSETDYQYVDSCVQKSLGFGSFPEIKEFSDISLKPIEHYLLNNNLPEMQDYKMACARLTKKEIILNHCLAYQNNKCAETVGENFAMVDGKCQKCSYSQHQFISDGNCIQCKTGEHIFKGQCVRKCKIYQIHEEQFPFACVYNQKGVDRVGKIAMIGVGAVLAGMVGVALYNNLKDADINWPHIDTSNWGLKPNWGKPNFNMNWPHWGKNNNSGSSSTTSTTSSTSSSSASVYNPRPTSATYYVPPYPPYGYGFDPYFTNSSYYDYSSQYQQNYNSSAGSIYFPYNFQ